MAVALRQSPRDRAGEAWFNQFAPTHMVFFGGIGQSLSDYVITSSAISSFASLLSGFSEM